MAISFVGSMAPVGANNGGNVTLTFTGASGLLNAAGGQATLLQGDVVVCAYASSGVADAAMSTSSSGWTEVHENYANGSANDTNLALYYKVMGSTPDTSFVAVGPTGNNNGTIATAFAFRGVDAAVLDIAFVAGNHAATGTASTRPNAPAITPSTAGAWILVAGAGAAAAGSALTNPGDLSATTNHFRSANHAETIDIAIGIGIKTDWTSGAFDAAAWTGGAANAGDSWAAMVIALRAVVLGTMAATESGADTFAASGDVIVTGAAAATEAATDTFAASGDVVVSGAQGATETGSDAFAGSGDVIVAGALSGAEIGPDTFAASGTVADSAVTGTLAATESGADTFAGSGDVVVTAAAAIVEAGADVFAGPGQVFVSGALAAEESGSDSLAASGSVLVEGALAATETGADALSGAGDVIVQGGLAVAELGADTFAGSGGQPQPVTGAMAATEAGEDGAAFAGLVLITGGLSANEAGADVFLGMPDIRRASAFRPAAPVARIRPGQAKESVFSRPAQRSTSVRGPGF